MRFLILLFLSAITFSLAGQNADLPKDFLNSEFYKERRSQLRSKLPSNSVAVFFTNAEHNRSNDVSFKFHQNTDFFYLTGFREPNAVLLIFKDKQVGLSGTPYDEIIFVQPHHEREELYNGKRLGDEGVKNQLGFVQAYTNKEFKRYNVDFSKFDKILFSDFFNDARNNPRDSSDLADLIIQFKKKVSYPDKESLSISPEPKKNNLDVKAIKGLMDDLRGIKTKEELPLLRKAVLVSCQSQIEVMKAIKPGMSELEIQGIHEYVFKKYQAEDVGYPSIVGSGHNGCILHYIDNYKPEISTKDLILMDLGAEYHGYSADITRTIPISGKFSPEQKQIYELVLAAQEEAMKLCKPGTPFPDLYAATWRVIHTGLMDLGISKSEADTKRYYPHGCSHHIGLDVHDRGNYDVLQENMAFTIEPGIYIPEGSKCDQKWWGIAVRIEDDYLITKDGYEHLSRLAPRTVKDIEDMMKQPSPLDSFVLPALDK